MLFATHTVTVELDRSRLSDEQVEALGKRYARAVDILLDLPARFEDMLSRADLDTEEDAPLEWTIDVQHS